MIENNPYSRCHIVHRTNPHVLNSYANTNAHELLCKVPTVDIEASIYVNKCIIIRMQVHRIFKIYIKVYFKLLIIIGYIFFESFELFNIFIFFFKYV